MFNGFALFAVILAITVPVAIACGLYHEIISLVAEFKTNKESRRDMVGSFIGAVVLVAMLAGAYRLVLYFWHNVYWL